MGVASVRLLRRERGWTLEALAQRADTTKSYLSKIERGHSTPSIAVAMKLADALEVDVAELFGDPDGSTMIEVTRATARDRSCASTPADSSTYLGLANGIISKQMLPFVLFPPTTATRCRFREHDGDEFVIVLSGAVELQFTSHSELLEEGDSAYFRGGVAHYFRSVGSEPAQVLAIIATTATP